MSDPDEGPEWADEAHLDEVFSTWVPGPPASAPAAEREMADNAPSATPASEEEIAAVLAEALAEAEGGPDDVAVDEADEPTEAEAEPEPAAYAEPVPAAAEPVPEPEPEPEPEVYAEPADAVYAEAAAGVTPDREADRFDFEPAPAPPPTPTKVARPWTRADDDILPNRGKGRRGS